MAAVPRREREVDEMQMDDEIRDVLASWGITWDRTVEEIEVILCDARMENTRKHTIVSYVGRLMVDGEDLGAAEVREALQQ